MKIAVIGGDMRHAKLSELLADMGHEVAVFGMDKTRLNENVESAKSAKEAVAGAKCVILPLPVVSKEGVLNTPLSGGIHTLQEALSPVSREQLVCAGRIDAKTRETAAEYGVTLIDYFAREELAVLNAEITAEGALQIIMEEIPITISRTKILIIGFGRVGKLLANRLKGLMGDVTVAARSHTDKAWIKALGYGVEDTGRLDGRLERYEVIVNTVPARVLGEERLSELSKECLCLDLASKPGGMDFSAASKLGVKAVWALSLPGEVAPVTSGEIIRDTILNMLEERGVEV